MKNWQVISPPAHEFCYTNYWVKNQCLLSRSFAIEVIHISRRPETHPLISARTTTKKKAGQEGIRIINLIPDIIVFEEGQQMIEVISGLPDHVIGIEAKGKVTRSDYETVIIPLVEEKLKRHKKINFLYYIGDEFSGTDTEAMWADAKAGLRHINAWKKIALVTNVDWIRWAVKLLEVIMPGHVKVFANDQLPEARVWIF